MMKLVYSNICNDLEEPLENLNESFSELSLCGWPQISHFISFLKSIWEVQVTRLLGLLGLPGLLGLLSSNSKKRF